MRTNLLLGDAASYEANISSWHSQDCLLQVIVAKRSQDLTTNAEDGVTLSGNGESCGERVVKNESPIIVRSQHGTRLQSIVRTLWWLWWWW